MNLDPSRDEIIEYLTNTLYLDKSDFVTNRLFEFDGYQSIKFLYDFSLKYGIDIGGTPLMQSNNKHILLVRLAKGALLLASLVLCGVWVKTDSYLLYSILGFLLLVSGVLVLLVFRKYYSPVFSTRALTANELLDAAMTKKWPNDMFLSKA